jgi:SEC-C motif-containing protein
MKISVNSPCPCGSGKKYKQCCEVYHKGKIATDAVFVMRARYSAFAVGNVDYILSTTHPQHEDSLKEEAVRREEIKHFSRITTFRKLEILKEERGEPLSYVTFRVFLEQEGKPLSFTEKSTFEKINGRWLYLRADFHGEFQAT